MLQEEFDSAYQTGEKITQKDNVCFMDLSYTQDTMERFNSNRIGLHIKVSHYFLHQYIFQVITW